MWLMAVTEKAVAKRAHSARLTPDLSGYYASDHGIARPHSALDLDGRRDRLDRLVALKIAPSFPIEMLTV